MLDDGSDELFAGFWPFMRRFLLAFLPLWVFLLGYAAGLNVIIAAIMNPIVNNSAHDSEFNLTNIAPIITE